MNIFNKLSQEEKYLILVRKLKEAFLSFTDNLLDVFTDKNLFLQRIISYQIPDTVLYIVLKNNIDIELIENQDESYLKYNLCFLKDYVNYVNENFYKNEDCFMFKYICDRNVIEFEENIEVIWNWMKILILLIKKIDSLKDKTN
jgi:hypothetical protein